MALDDQLIVPNQIVGVVNSTRYWLGFMGLGVKVTNFTDANQPTFLTTLAENQKRIPSRSYGYTAGASHRELYHTHIRPVSSRLSTYPVIILSQASRAFQPLSL